MMALKSNKKKKIVHKELELRTGQQFGFDAGDGMFQREYQWSLGHHQGKLDKPAV